MKDDYHLYLMKIADFCTDFADKMLCFVACELLVEITKIRGGVLSTVQQMEITLMYLCDPGFQRSAAYQYQDSVTQSTISETVTKTILQIKFF